MKIAVLGATGQTGQFLIKQALEQGHTVTAIVRNPAKLAVHNDNLKVIKQVQRCGALFLTAAVERRPACVPVL